jgi:hypothetical protein
MNLGKFAQLWAAQATETIGHVEFWVYSVEDVPRKVFDHKRGIGNVGFLGRHVAGADGNYDNATRER